MYDKIPQSSLSEFHFLEDYSQLLAFRFQDFFLKINFKDYLSSAIIPIFYSIKISTFF